MLFSNLTWTSFLPRQLKTTAPTFHCVMSVSLSDIDRVYLNNKAMATIVKSISNSPVTLWATFVPCIGFTVLCFSLWLTLRSVRGRVLYHWCIGFTVLCFSLWLTLRSVRGRVRYRWFLWSLWRWSNKVTRMYYVTVPTAMSTIALHKSSETENSSPLKLVISRYINGELLTIKASHLKVYKRRTPYH